jgi:hypothetical protein
MTRWIRARYSARELEDAEAVESVFMAFVSTHMIRGLANAGPGEAAPGARPVLAGAGLKACPDSRLQLHFVQT